MARILFFLKVAGGPSMWPPKEATVVVVHLDHATYLRWLAELGDLWIGRQFFPTHRLSPTPRRKVA